MRKHGGTKKHIDKFLDQLQNTMVVDVQKIALPECLAVIPDISPAMFHHSSPTVLPVERNGQKCEMIRAFIMPIVEQQTWKNQKTTAEIRKIYCRRDMDQS